LPHSKTLYYAVFFRGGRVETKGKTSTLLVTAVKINTIFTGFSS